MLSLIPALSLTENFARGDAYEYARLPPGRDIRWWQSTSRTYSSATSRSCRRPVSTSWPPRQGTSAQALREVHTRRAREVIGWLDGADRFTADLGEA